MRSQRLALLATFAASAGALLAQDPPPTPIYVPYALDSGYVNAQPGAQATHVGDVHYPGTSSLQI